MVQAVLKNNKPAIFGMVVLVPALLFETVGISHLIARNNALHQAFNAFFEDPSQSGISLAMQALVLVGPFVALVLTLIPTVSVNVRTDQFNLISTITIRGKLLNIAVIALSVIALAILGAYVIMENWYCIIGLRTSC